MPIERCRGTAAIAGSPREGAITCINGAILRHWPRGLLRGAALLAAVWLLTPGLAAAGSTNHAWQFVAPLPTARASLATAVGLDGTVYAFGGIMDHPSESPSAILHDVEAYTPRTNTWFARAPMTVARTGATAATGPDGTIYVFGGNDGLGDLTSTGVAAYDPITNSWSTRSPMPVTGIATAGRGGTIYLVAGRRQGKGPPNQIAAYDPTSDSWSIKAPMPAPRDAAAVTTGLGGWIYVIGGQTPKGVPLRTVEAYNPATNRWMTRASLPAPRHWFAATTGRNGLIYAIGGDGAGYRTSNTVMVYNPKTNRWAPAPSMHVQRTFEAAVTGRDGTMYALAGSGLSSKVRTVEAYTPSPGIG